MEFAAAVLRCRLLAVPGRFIGWLDGTSDGHPHGYGKQRWWPSTLPAVESVLAEVAPGECERLSLVFQEWVFYNVFLSKLQFALEGTEFSVIIGLYSS